MADPATQNPLGNSRRGLFIGLGIALVVGIAGWAFLNRRENVDVVNGVSPVSRSMASIADTLAELQRLSPTERGAYLERTWPHLAEDVVYFVRRQGRIPTGARVQRVEFFYGSLENVGAESANGDRYGYFNNQLVALVSVEGIAKPFKVIVQCLNGTFVLDEDLRRLQAIGSHTPIEQFTIGQGEGLVHHVDFPTAISIAEQHGLPLYRGHTLTSQARLTPAQARLLESQTDRLQVTVLVYEGDQFDLARGIYVPVSGG